MTNIELELSNVLNKIANEDGFFNNGKPKFGLIKRYANGRELHKCRACGSYHSGNKNGSTHTCRAK